MTLIQTIDTSNSTGSEIVAEKILDYIKLPNKEGIPVSISTHDRLALTTSENLVTNHGYSSIENADADLKNVANYIGDKEPYFCGIVVAAGEPYFVFNIDGVKKTVSRIFFVSHPDNIQDTQH